MTENTNQTHEDKLQLDRYLKEIEYALSSISVSDRCDILMELNSHIQESLGKGEQDLKSILKSLGEPREVASRYLITRGLTPLPAQRKPFLRWALISIVAAFSLAMIAAVILVRSFSPVLQISDEGISILGGTIEVSDDGIRVGGEEVEGRISINHFDGDKVSLKGSVTTGANIKKIETIARNGTMRIEGHDSKTVAYKCDLNIEDGSTPPTNNDVIQEENGVLALRFADNIHGVGCKIRVPYGIDIRTELSNGKLNFEELSQGVEARITNGKINFETRDGERYVFKTRVDNGVVKGLREVSSSDSGHLVDLKVGNGVIKLDD